MTLSSLPPSFSGPTVLTIVARTSAVAATVAMFATEFSELVLTAASASPDTKPNRPMEPSAAAVPLTSVRRVCADSPAFCPSMVSNRWFVTSDTAVLLLVGVSPVPARGRADRMPRRSCTDRSLQ
ncbi:MAG: hypothetical protein ACXVFL_19245 [Solirubrobacteraceae bacterium]